MGVALTSFYARAQAVIFALEQKNIGATVMALEGVRYCRDALDSPDCPREILLVAFS